jgi:type VI secretion system protein ImpK
MQSTTHRSAHNLAIILQEVLTAIERLRSNRESVSDAVSFRGQIREALRLVDQEGRQMGYSQDETRLAIFAAVAFLDESVLNSKSSAFVSWPSKPLQEELFGGHVAGETFFVNLESLLRANDSSNVADVLEVYQLCLLLGYQGRYTMGNRGELHAIKQATAEKIKRIRGVSVLAPDSAPPASGARAVAFDPVVRWLKYGAIFCGALAIILFFAFKFTLNSGVSTVADLTSQTSALR